MVGALFGTGGRISEKEAEKLCARSPATTFPTRPASS